ncbi:MAG: response regulator transcription factor [Slackia sp.]|nr:response regulator transcription factor [Slackia sp.]
MTEIDKKPLMLIVEDERDIADMLKSYFEMSGYLAMVASDGAQALEKAKRSPDIILLDVGLPDIDGFSVCRMLRDVHVCPIIFLTARVEDADAIDGFSAGADDYVTKPFSLEVLGARVKAQLARGERLKRVSAVRIDDALSIDYGAMTVSVCGKPVTLARKEYEICALLTKHAGQVFDRDMIYKRVWGAPGDSTVVTEHVRRLRRALAAAGAEKEYVKTVWGVGYTWQS